MEYFVANYDIAVVGAGHAGIEAALAAARMGLKTVVFTINLDAVGNMPCNPAIGGTGKGHLVRELDALGGEMGWAADHCCIQYRMLNRGKGPAVHSLRAQADRRAYQEFMKHRLETQENLDLKQAMIVDVRTENGAVCAVVTQLGAIYGCRAVILATGTYLESTVIIGENVISSGPDGMHAAVGLTERLRALGLSMRRFKTGTPPRVNRRSIDFDAMELQPGDEQTVGFSFRTLDPPKTAPSATSPIPQPPPMRSSAPTWTAARSTTAPSSASARATAPPSKRRSSASPKSPGTSSLWSPAVPGRTKCTSRASPPPCPRTCSLPCCTPSPAWSTRR